MLLGGRRRYNAPKYITLTAFVARTELLRGRHSSCCINMHVAPGVVDVVARIVTNHL